MNNLTKAPSSSADPPPLPPAQPAKKKHAAPKGPPWSEQETTSLIRAYQEKWYSLKRGLLRSHQWDSVAASVASLCGLDQPPKSGVQCRHKMEKLRKRYRDELQRPSPSRWPLFPHMDHLERGPLPISSLPPSSSTDLDTSDDNNDDEEVVLGSAQNGGPRRVVIVEEEEEEEGGWREEVAEVIMRYEEGCLRIEKRRMEIVREFERDLMELEAKRAEMAFDSRRRLAEVVDRALRPSAKKTKRPPLANDKNPVSGSLH